MSISNFSRNYTALRNVALGSIALLVFSQLAWAWIYVQGVYGREQNVYVVSDQGTFLATHQPASFRDKVEVMDHLEKFTHLMFSHDKDTYESNLEKGLHLINSHEGLVIQEGFEKEGLLEMYIRRGARWEALLDTVIVNMETLPISGQVYWRQKTIVGEQERVLGAAASFELSSWPRSEKNRNGLKIHTWKYIPYDASYSN